MLEYKSATRLTEICSELDISYTICIELVECGMVSPQGNHPEDWLFDQNMVSLFMRAIRIQKELDLEWPAVAVLVNLMEERDQLRSEVTFLKQRLERFLADS